MNRPPVVYVRPVNATLAGFPPKPSGPISQAEWERLCSETAQYQDLGDLGWGGSFGGAISSVTNSVSHAVSTVAKPVASIAKPAVSVLKPAFNNVATVLPKPTVFIQKPWTGVTNTIHNAASSVASHGGNAFRHARHGVQSVARPVQHIIGQAVKPFAVVTKPATGIFNQMVGKIIPGVAPKPPEPSQWPAQFPDGFVANNQAEFDKHVADTTYLNPYSKRPISQSEYQLWIDAGANQWFVPAGWHPGDKLPDQAAIDAMKSADYADGYRPATKSDFDAYVSAVNAFNSQPAQQPQVSATAPAPAPVPTSISQASGASQITAPAAQPMTIDQAQSIAPAAPAQPVSAPAVEPMSIEQAKNLLNAPTQTDPGAAVSSKSNAPMSLIAAAAAGAFFLFKK